MKRVLLLALGLALTASAGTRRPYAEKKVKIVVAARDLPAGHIIIAPADLAVIEISEDAATRSMVEGEQRKYLEGRRLAFPMLEGDPVLSSLFESQEGGEEISQLCADAVREAPSAEGQIARHRQVVLERRL